MPRRPLALLIVCVLSLAACGGDEEASTADPTTTSTIATTTTIALATGSGDGSDEPGDVSPASTTDPEPPATDPEPPATDPPPTDPPVPEGSDPCLVGTWELQSQRFFDELIAQAGADFPGAVTHTGGRQFIEMSADGTARGGRDHWEFAIDSPEGTVYVQLDAIDEGSYSVDGEQFFIEHAATGPVDMILEIDTGGGRMPFPNMPGGSFPGEDAAAVSGTYACSNDVFELTATIDGITLTNVWDRVAG